MPFKTLSLSHTQPELDSSNHRCNFCLEPDAGTEGEPPVRQALEAQQRTVIHTILLDFGLSQIHAFDADVDIVGQVIGYTAVQLSTRGSSDREANRTAQTCTAGRIQCAERIPVRPLLDSRMAVPRLSASDVFSARPPLNF